MRTSGSIILSKSPQPKISCSFTMGKIPGSGRLSSKANGWGARVGASLRRKAAFKVETTPVPNRIGIRVLACAINRAAAIILSGWDQMI